VGKFSKPRKNFSDAQETVILPKPPVSPKPNPAAAPENQPAAPEINDVPVVEPQSDFDPFDTASSESAKKSRKIMLISLCSVAAVLLIGVIAAVWFLFGRDPNNHLILNNVYAAGVNLGGMTKDEAEAALHQATDLTFTQNDMIIELPDIILSLSPADTKAALDGVR